MNTKSKNKMKLAFVGLGKMGAGMTKRILKDGHEVVVFDLSQEAVASVEKEGAQGASSIEEAVKNLEGTKIVWLMIPNQFVDETIEKIEPLLKEGDILIDGGNSNFELSAERGKMLAKKGINFLDVGTSGGLRGAEVGYSMMLGGNKSAYFHIEPIIKALAIENGYGYFGPSGAGHFVKMVHNAIEYGIMQAIGEGFDMLHNGPYKDIDLLKTTQVWNHGSIIRSFLMEMMEQALEEDKKLSKSPTEVGDSGEGKWAVETALKHNIPFTVNTYALFHRYITRREDFAAKTLAAMRTQFGGHTNKERA